MLVQSGLWLTSFLILMQQECNLKLKLKLLINILILTEMLWELKMLNKYLKLLVLVILDGLWKLFTTGQVVLQVIKLVMVIL